MSRNVTRYTIRIETTGNESVALQVVVTLTKARLELVDVRIRRGSRRMRPIPRFYPVADAVSTTDRRNALCPGNLVFLGMPQLRFAVPSALPTDSRVFLVLSKFPVGCGIM